MSRPERDTLKKEAYCPICEASFTAANKNCAACGGPLMVLEQAEDSLVGTDLNGRYTLKERLGSGGMGSVYLAEQLSVEREVVIKVIRPELSNDILTAKRFLREAKMASRLSHPHNVSVFEFGQTSTGLLFLAMELLRGETLYDLMERVGVFEHTRACEIVLQIFDGLAAAHRENIVHRDLKPANVFILDHPPGRDFVKILDFGLAKSLVGHNTATERGMMMGTPAYMAPEMIFDGDVDLRSDLYATGIILYELLTGALPFEQTEVRKLLVAQAYAPAPALGAPVPAPIAHVVATLLKKEPSERFASARLAHDALTAALAVADATDIRQLESPTKETRAEVGHGEEDATRPALVPAPAATARPMGSTSILSVPRFRKRWPIYALGAAGLLALGVVIVASLSRTPIERDATHVTPIDAPPRARSPIVSPLAIDAGPAAVSADIPPLEPAPARSDAAADLRADAKTSKKKRRPPKSAQATKPSGESTRPVEPKRPAEPDKAKVPF